MLLEALDPKMLCWKYVRLVDFGVADAADDLAADDLAGALAV
jgi:hypothetical protein